MFDSKIIEISTFGKWSMYFTSMIEIRILKITKEEWGISLTSMVKIRIIEFSVFNLSF
jgi:hypothetical protein